MILSGVRRFTKYDATGLLQAKRLLGRGRLRGREIPLLIGSSRATAMERTTPTQHTIDTPYMVGPVHCYTAKRAGELVLFDTGPPTDTARQYLKNTIDFGRLRHVFITHCHIDHYGLASWLSERTDAEIYLSYRDHLKMARHDERMDHMYRFLLEAGFDKRYIVGLRRVMNSGVIFPSFPKRYKVVEEELPERLAIDVLNCPGHSQSDLVYVGEDWAVTGDILLKGIFQSPLLDVDLESGERFRNYDAYCGSIVKLAALGEKKVLPGHRYGIDSIGETIVFYISKMLQRVEQLLPFAGEKQVASIIAKMFGDAFKDPFHIYIKVSEILFMLDFIENPELLREALQQIDLYEPIAERFSSVTGR